MMPTLNNLLAQFQAAGERYSVGIQPYALHLFLALFTIDIIVTYVQYVGDGQLDPNYFLARLLRHVLGGGFTYAMIIHGFTWMGEVIQSFSRIGAAVTGVALDPDGILKAGVSMADTLMNSPIGTGIISAIALGVVAAAIAVIIVIAFAAAAVELLLTLVYAYVGIGMGVLLLAFGGLRFTAPTAEGYFQNVIRTGVKILFIYAVLGIGMQVVDGWNAALLAACHPATKSAWSYPDPFGVATFGPVSTCTSTISIGDMFGFLAMALVFVACVIGVPRMAANLAGGIVGHGLEHVAAAYYIGRNVAGAVAGALRGAGNNGGGRVGGSTISNAAKPWVGSPAAQQFAAQTAAKAQQTPDASTKPLNPYSDPSKPPGYNLRGFQQPQQPINPNGQTSGAGPANSPTAKKTTTL